MSNLNSCHPVFKILSEATFLVSTLKGPTLLSQLNYLQFYQKKFLAPKFQKDKNFAIRSIIDQDISLKKVEEQIDSINLSHYENSFFDSLNQNLHTQSFTLGR